MAKKRRGRPRKPGRPKGSGKKRAKKTGSKRGNPAFHLAPVVKSVASKVDHLDTKVKAIDLRVGDIDKHVFGRSRARAAKVAAEEAALAAKYN